MKKKKKLMHEDKIHIKIYENKSHFMLIGFKDTSISLFLTISVKLDIFRNKAWHLQVKKALLN